MKNLFLWSFNLLVAGVVACQSISHSADKSMLKPGDEIDGMVITTGASQASPLWAFCSPALENNGVMRANCQVPGSTSLAIGHTFGWTDPALQTLDWSALTWELYLDERPIDLDAFGIHNFVMPDLAPHPSPIREIFRQIKAWDVVLTNPSAGAHVLRGMACADTGTYKWIVNFTVEAPLEQ